MDNQNLNPLPKDGNSKKSAIDFLPVFFRTAENKKFLQGTIDQLINQGSAEKLSGYVGRKTAPAYKASDLYIKDVSPDRENYQLEPALVIKDEYDNVLMYKDYNDYINTINNFFGNTNDHSRLNSQEMYSWNPNIDWDKFVNFREYYWLPTGPDPVSIYGQSNEISSTISVSLVDNDDNVSYNFSIDKNLSNPQLTLYRGQRYRFEINTPGFPIAFAISREFSPDTLLMFESYKTVQINPGIYDKIDYDIINYDIASFADIPLNANQSYYTGVQTEIIEGENLSTIYPDGIKKFDKDGNEIFVVFIEQGVIEFTVPQNAPDHLFYISKNEIDTGGLIIIKDIIENTYLNIEEDILGKVHYTSSNGVEFSNGLKLEFHGNVYPEKYAEDFWYVEGVGSAIRLISSKDLVIPASYTEEQPVAYDSDRFDTLPFVNENSYAKTKDYVIINRASLDKNAWSRYNKWFHKDIIVKSAEYNNQIVELDDNARAKRPIIEFEADLKLFNYGVRAKQNVDLVDTYTTDVFSTIEGQLGYNIDNIDLVDNMRILFTNDKDPLVYGKIFQVKFVTFKGVKQIHLIETEDSTPTELDSVLVTQGYNYAGKMLYFSDNKWLVAQSKTQINQPPLFDLFDNNGHSFGDDDVYKASTFRGTRIFNYAVSTSSTIDSELGFPVKYRAIANTGDIVFEFELLTKSFTYETLTSVNEITFDQGFLKKYKEDTIEYVNGFSNKPTMSKQYVIRQYISTKTQNTQFKIDQYDQAGTLTDIKVIVYKNKKIQLLNKDYTLNKSANDLYVIFNQALPINSIIEIKTTSSAYKNKNGYYEIPYNLERNPLNQNINEFTLGEVINHVDSMIEELPTFDGEYPGNSNLRDLGDIDSYGKRFVKHSGPLNLPLYHFTSQKYNIIRAIEYNKHEYTRFKHTFLTTAESYPYTGNTKQHVDTLIREINKDKLISQPFFASDMIGHGDANRIEYRILDPRSKLYGITTPFDMTVISNKSILVYLNYQQLVYDVDYIFNSDGYVEILSDLLEGDILEIYEYASTNGNFIPATPSKLGLYPKFIPEFITDDTYQTVIPVTNDRYKIYGQLADNANIRGWFYPVYNDKNIAQQYDISLGGTGNVKELRLNGQSIPVYYSELDFYSGNRDSNRYKLYPKSITFIKGHDGSYTTAYYDFRDELLLELENRIFNNIKSTYDDKLIDIYNFKPSDFRKNELSNQEINESLIPSFIQWLPLVDRDYTANYFYDNSQSFTYNYSSATNLNDDLIAGFWRGVYFNAFDTDAPHLRPWEMLGFSIKPKWWETTYGPAPYTKNNLILWRDLEQGIVREPNKQIIFKDKFKRPGLTSVIPVDEHGNLLSPLYSGYAKHLNQRTTNRNFVFGDYSPVESAWRKSSEYPFSLIATMVKNKPALLFGVGYDTSNIFRNLANQIVYKPTNKPIELDQLIIPNRCDLSTLQTSGLINFIQELIARDRLIECNDYQYEIRNIKNQLGFKLAGFSDTSKLNVVLDSRSPQQVEIENKIYIPNENFKTVFNVSSPVSFSRYSGIIVEKHDDGFVINGYDRELSYFEYYEANKADYIKVNVGGVSESYVKWEKDKSYYKGQIINYNNKYYRVLSNFTSTELFSTEHIIQLQELPITGGKEALFYKSFNRSLIKKVAYGTKFTTAQELVDVILGYNELLKDRGFVFDYVDSYGGLHNWENMAKEFLYWSIQGWSAGSVVTFSPAAYKLQLQQDYLVADDIFNKFYPYSILQENGEPLAREFNHLYRNENSFGLESVNTDYGIYSAVIPMVQKEHVVLIDNKTVFDDIIYEPETGYRQDRLKITGYRSANWNGSLNIPGFIFDDVVIVDWKQWQDYKIGSVVKYKQYYYIAINNVSGSKDFEVVNWYKLSEKPEPELTTNFDFRINQFMDYYDIDTSGFNPDIQKLSTHLIGYQPRSYLSNIINDDISQYKFYQGYIKDKGTQNSLLKLFNPLNSTNLETLEFYEEWALQTGRYGAINNEHHVEFNLDKNKIVNSPQAFELIKTNAYSTNYDNVYRILPHEVYDKEHDYDHNPFPVLKTKLQEYIKTSGYVNNEDVRYIVTYKRSLPALNVNNFSLGDYVWITEQGDNDWHVFQHVKTTLKVNKCQILSSDLTTGNLTFELTLDSWIKNKIQIGDICGIRNALAYNSYGFFEITNVILDKLTCVTTVNTNLKSFADEQLTLTRLRDVRATDTSELSYIAYDQLYTNQKVWVDNFKDTWAVFENNPVFNSYDVLKNPLPNDNTFHNFGYEITASDDNKSIAVSSPYKQTVSIFSKVTETATLALNETLYLDELAMSIPQNKKDNLSISFSPDGEFLAIGIPTASQVLTKFKGFYNSTETYLKNDIVRYNQKLWKALVNINNSSIPHETNPNYIRIYHIPVTELGNPGVEYEGAVAIYRRQKNGVYNLKTAITSSYKIPNRQFGYNIKLIQKDKFYTLLVGNKNDGYSNNDGSIEIFNHGYTSEQIYRGEYSSLIEYNINDILYDQGDYYIAVKPVPSNIPLTNQEYWRLYSWREAVDPQYKGKHSSEFNYSIGSIVTFNGKTYQSKTSIASGQVFNPLNWDEISVYTDYIGHLPNFIAESYNWKTIDTSYQANHNDALIVNSFKNPLTIALPDNPIAGTTVTIVDAYDFSKNNVTVSSVNSDFEHYPYKETILNVKGLNIEFIYDGAIWQINTNLSQETGIIIDGTYKWKTVTSDYTAKDKDALFADSKNGYFEISLPENPTKNTSIIICDAVSENLIDGHSFEDKFISIKGNGSTIETTRDEIIVDFKGLKLELIYNGETWIVYNNFRKMNTVLTDHRVKWTLKYEDYIAQANDSILVNAENNDVIVTLPETPVTGTIITIVDANLYATYNIKLSAVNSIRSVYFTDPVPLYDNNDTRGVRLELIFDGDTWQIYSNTRAPLGILLGKSTYSEYNQIFGEIIVDFGTKFDASKNGEVIVSLYKSLEYTTINTKLAVYRIKDDRYLLNQVIDIPIEYSEISNIAINPQGDKFVISVPLDDTKKLDQGTVYVYALKDGEFVQTQAIYPPNNEMNEQFGYSLAFGSDNLVISSLRGDQTFPTQFDATFDDKFTTFSSTLIDTGIVYIYEDINNEFVFSEKLIYDDIIPNSGFSLCSSNNHIYLGIPSFKPLEENGIVIDYKKIINKNAWNILRQEIPPVDINKIKGAFLYNKSKNQIVTYLDYIDIIQGKIAGVAEQELSFKTGYDPAKFSNGSTTDKNVDAKSYWAQEHVGKLWWDISTARVEYPYQGSIQYQISKWNTLLPGSSIDIYEWVESDYLPEEWDVLADTTKGLALNISGTSLYKNAKYSIRNTYDDIAKKFKVKYYFWVKNKRTIPTDTYRQLSSYNVSTLIAKPRENGYRFISFNGSNKFILNNCDNLISSDEYVLHIRYVDEDVDTNIHSQYQILTEGNNDIKINQDIEQKWYDSLIGFDYKNRAIPDTSIPLKHRYGIQNRPRQSMFVNRIEALKQLIERVNLILANYIIADIRDISALDQKELPPSFNSHEYDISIETVEELEYVSTYKLEPAVLKPIVSNGKVSKIQIINSGRGYKYAPNINIIGAGQEAEATASINELGQIVNVTITNKGHGYDEKTSISIRQFSVLVQNDQTVFNKWAIYSWNNISKTWLRKSVQDYDVTVFWDYVDWYDKSLSSNYLINYTIEHSNELTTISPRIGDIIKINNSGNGTWMLLTKIADYITSDATTNFKVIGKEKGTFQIKDTIYDYSKNTVGFDNKSFDNYFFDNNPATELRIILETLRDDILINELSTEYNTLFFSSIRYILSEQNYVDWIFKTSFVKTIHNLGELQQHISFKNENLKSFQEYVNEVKPYSTKIREFVSRYSSLENTQTTVNDFDLPPYYDSIKQRITSNQSRIINNTLIESESNLYLPPRNKWVENNSYSVVDIQVSDTGTGYIEKPTIILQGGGGTGATASAFISYGKLISITVTNPGHGYLSAPEIIIQGRQSENSIPARASVILGDTKARTLSTTIKFDRLSGKFYYSDLLTKEIYYGTGARSIYNLDWPMATEKSKIKVFVDGIELLRSEFQIQNINSAETKEYFVINKEFMYDEIQGSGRSNQQSKTGYIKEIGQIIFTVPPSLNSKIEIEYYKSLSLLTAEDRIQFAYNPDNELPGRDLAQLMTGVDYGGVHIQGIDFGNASGWDSQGWNTDFWDSAEVNPEEITFIADDSTTIIPLDTPLIKDELYTVHKNGIRIDDEHYGTYEQTNIYAEINSIVGTGNETYIDLIELGVSIGSNDKIIIRKITSDGAEALNTTLYDMELSGGDLKYSTAQGIRAEEMIIDGDDFISNTYSSGPEELIPGQVHDTLDIRVYSRDTSGQGRIFSQYYTNAQSGDTFELDIVPNSPSAVFIKNDDHILSDNEYQINWQTNTITITGNLTSPKLNIIAFSHSTQSMISTGQLNGSQTDIYDLDVEYDSKFGSFITVNGESINYTLIDNNGNIQIQFDNTLDTTDVIHYTIFNNNDVVNYSVVSKDVFYGDGEQTEFNLHHSPLYQAPIHQNIIVKVNDDILSSGYNIKYTINLNNKEYKLHQFQYPIYNNIADDLDVYLNGQLLTYQSDWSYESSTSSIRLSDKIGIDGDSLEIYNMENSEYHIENNRVILDIAPNNLDKVEIFQFTNHDLLDIDRINYDVINRMTVNISESDNEIYQRLTEGEIKLRSYAEDAQYVWVIVNNKLKIPNIDYYLLSDHRTIRIIEIPEQNDSIELIHFTAPVTGKKIAFRQFKDILNRTHYKKIAQKTRLTKPLTSYDLRIEVEDGSILGDPNKQRNLPGIIFIDGERIEYFVKEGNVLRQLRRGTLGTGIKSFYDINTIVYDQNTNLTIPYQDNILVQDYTVNGTQIEYIVDYQINTSNEIEVFVAGTRLNKQESMKYELGYNEDHTEINSDVIQPADFIVSGNKVILTKTPNEILNETDLDSITVSIVKKIGHVWTTNDIPLANSQNNITKFLS